MGGGCIVSISPCWPLHTYPQRVVNGRGVTRLDGARGKKQVWRPNVRTCLSQANVLYWRKYLWLCWDFPALHAVIRPPPRWFGARELCPLAPPCYAPGKRPHFQAWTRPEPDITSPYPARARHLYLKPDFDPKAKFTKGVKACATAE